MSTGAMAHMQPGGSRVVVEAPVEVTSELLSRAAEFLPAMVDRVPVLTSDVYNALLAAAIRQDPDAGRPEHLRRSGEALDAFLAYLTGTGQVAPGQRSGQALRGWLHGQSPASVRRALLEAAAHWRPHPGTQRPGTPRPGTPNPGTPEPGTDPGAPNDRRSR